MLCRYICNSFMLRFVRLFTFLMFFAPGKIYSQDSLPKISVINRAGVIIIGWKNGYKNPVSNISIQRSYDSLKNFTTIGSVLNAQNKENGYADIKPPYSKMYYRVFISFEGGRYTFSQTRKPVKERRDTTGLANNPELARKLHLLDSIERVEAIRIADSLQRLANPGHEMWLPSRNLFTGKDNNLVINLPDAQYKKYSAKFYDADSVLLFELNKITETYLLLDKVNFIRSGWFYFELYENGILKEKNKFYIPKDGKITNSASEIYRRNNK